MKVGDIVRHKNVLKKKFQVSKVEQVIAIVDRIEEPKIWYPGRQVMDYKKYICRLENLIPVSDQEGQLKMF